MIQLSASMLEFITDRHLAVLATQRADGSPHAVPVGFTLSNGLVRVITSASSVKARNARRGGRASVTQIDGGRWVTFEGPVRLQEDAATVASAVAAYAQRYRQPGDRDDRVVIEIEVDRVMCSNGLK